MKQRRVWAALYVEDNGAPSFVGIFTTPEAGQRASQDHWVKDADPNEDERLLAWRPLGKDRRAQRPNVKVLGGEGTYAETVYGCYYVVEQKVRDL